MKILLLGNTGQLGWELERALAPLGAVTTLGYPLLDLTDLDATVALVRQSRPNLIVNATAYTAVDRAESEVDLATAVNAIGPGVLAEEAQSLKAAFIHFSTDYVFDGSKDSPYLETDPPNPLGVYGSSKLAGERAVQQIGGAHIVLRTAWVYSLRRESFVTKVLSWARKQTKLYLVADQVSNPTWARMLAEATALLVARGGADLYGWIKERGGLYHLAGDGFASRLEFGQAILEYDLLKEEQVVQEVLPALTVDFPAPAKRPLFSALDCTKFKSVFNLQLPNWRNALKLAMQS